MKTGILVVLVTTLALFSCRKDKTPTPHYTSLYSGTYDVTNYGSSGGPGGPNSGVWEYQLKIEDHETSPDSLILDGFVNINLFGTGIYHITVLRFSPTEFVVPQQYIETEVDWLSQYQFILGSGYFVGDSVYYEYQYLNDIGDSRWGSGAGVKID